ncbi:MAG TPA: hypothetical protein VLB01_03365 [Thermodesulfobacteriota bacterium]|nr:hypothetical protein [Thermodesulfobacteriota bacterium]
MTQKNKWYHWVMVVGVLFLFGALGWGYSKNYVPFLSKMSPSAPSVLAAVNGTNSKRQVHFVPNSFRFWDKTRNWPTSFGPAYADIVLEPSNFLPCRGGPFALCYYSGPNPETCTLTDDGRSANCECFEIPYGTYFVLISGILNYEVYLKTVRECGEDGSKCQEVNQAPVCEDINQNKFIPGADMISTFSFDCVPEEGIGQKNCENPPPYAGCMTAPCYRTDEEGIVQCTCPVFDGPYQVGQFDAQCDLESDLVWSAAFNPNEEGKTFPTPPTCIPDAPGELGCPLLPQQIPSPPPNVDCNKVCEEYQSCQGAGGVEIGFTCDATLCTSTCNDRDLVKVACSGLQSCEISEIVKLETEVGCSCCASQICGCEPNDQTNAAIFDLNQQQRDRGITPQCDVNGTLCGVQP